MQGMRRHLAVLAAVLAPLAAPAVAAAKEISQVSVCGTGGQCTTYDKSSRIDLMALAQDAGPTDPPRAAAPWYRVRFTVDEREHGGGLHSWTVAYVPSAGALRVDEGRGFAWVALSPSTAAAFERAARDLPPFPETRLRGLDVEPPRAQVDAVYVPGAETAGDSGATPWGWIAAGTIAAALVLVLLLLLLARSQRRPRPAEPTPT